MVLIESWRMTAVIAEPTRASPPVPTAIQPRVEEPPDACPESFALADAPGELVEAGLGAGGVADVATLGAAAMGTDVNATSIRFSSFSVMVTSRENAWPGELAAMM